MNESSDNALSHLRSYGLQPFQLLQVASWITLAYLSYAVPSRWSYSTTMDRARVECFVCRLKRRGFLSSDTPIATLVLEREDRLF